MFISVTPDVSYSTYKWSSFVLIALQITSTFMYLWKGFLDNLLATRLLQCCKLVTRLLEPQYFHEDKLASKRYSLFSNSKHAKISVQLSLWTTTEAIGLLTTFLVNIYSF